MKSFACIRNHMFGKCHENTSCNKITSCNSRVQVGYVYIRIWNLYKRGPTILYSVYVKISMTSFCNPKQSMLWNVIKNILSY